MKSHVLQVNRQPLTANLLSDLLRESRVFKAAVGTFGMHIHNLFVFYLEQILISTDGEMFSHHASVFRIGKITIALHLFGIASQRVSCYN